MIKIRKMKVYHRTHLKSKIPLSNLANERGQMQQESLNLCEADGRFVSATAVHIDGQYHLRDAPRPEEHSCWASGHTFSITKARKMMYKKVEEDPTRSVLEIYEEVRNGFTEGMNQSAMQSFLQEFPMEVNAKSSLQKEERVYPSQPN